MFEARAKCHITICLFFSNTIDTVESRKTFARPPVVVGKSCRTPQQILWRVNGFLSLLYWTHYTYECPKTWGLLECTPDVKMTIFLLFITKEPKDVPDHFSDFPTSLLTCKSFQLPGPINLKRKKERNIFLEYLWNLKGWEFLPIKDLD